MLPKMQFRTTREMPDTQRSAKYGCHVSIIYEVDDVSFLAMSNKNDGFRKKSTGLSGLQSSIDGQKSFLLVLLR